MLLEFLVLAVLVPVWLVLRLGQKVFKDFVVDFGEHARDVNLCLGALTAELEPVACEDQLKVLQAVGGEGVAGELVEAIEVEKGVFDDLHLVKLVQVSASRVERFAGCQRLLNVSLHLREGVVVR